jgi:TRAP-type C4-dicarboxylate transport system substrate-binding protein
MRRIKMKKLFFTLLTMVLAIALIVPYSSAAEEPITFKLSVETNEKMDVNVGLKVFRCLLEKNSKGRLKVDYYHSAQLYKGKDEPKALKIGTLQMAVPGIWLLDAIDRHASITSLPMFYGLPDEVLTRLIDMEVGKSLSERFEKKLDVKILGRWYWHGNSGVGTKNKPIRTLEDWKGQKIRVAGGAANALRLEAFGAKTMLIPWPDVPMAMIQGTVDGLVTGVVPVRTAKLWETGLRYWTQDNAAFVFFVPMMNGKFWRSLPKDLQKVILDTWEEQVDYERGNLVLLEGKSREEMMENGIEIIYPPQEEMARWRARIMPTQEKVVEETGMDKDFVARVQKSIEETLKK